jgi:hypothetical protein
MLWIKLLLLLLLGCKLARIWNIDSNKLSSPVTPGEIHEGVILVENH